ncbi:unnamed protein product [Ceutorhynchus assimilis]|uniref:Ig-like domain-containing protein n=1 Tax=Ceutorhynchus assimilis TaxID=467358 RepID=A0A9N9MT98_9CUCU|nr:unnamed protein product [Ceutorhynchus assimilis]
MNFLKLYLIIRLINLRSSQGNEGEGPVETKECRERDRLVGSDKEDLYSLVDVIEGQTLILRCRFCKEEHTDRPKNWFKVDQIGITEAHEVKLDMNNDPQQNRVTVNHKHSLVINNFTVNDTGFYYCLNFEDKTNDEKFNYLVDIVFPEQSDNYEKEFVYLKEILKINAEMVTQWAPWGTCEACGRPQGEGVMKKKGNCRIKLTPYAYQPKNLSPEEVYLYQAPAVSCRSKRLYATFPHISNYTNRIPDFILEDRCTASCNPDAEGVFFIGWKVGKGKGFKYKKHSVLQEGSHLTFVCPESSLDNKVAWKKNGRALPRGDNSNPHVIVDTFNTLYLVEVTQVDAGNYTCYVDDIRMQQIVIFVYSKTKLLTNEMVRYFMYLGFVLFLSSFCYCGGLVILFKRRHLYKTYEELKEALSKPNAEELENLV